MADQCIVCLETLDTLPTNSDQELPGNRLEGDDSHPASAKADPGNFHNHTHVAIIKTCGHILHDACLKEWSQKANSCPICRRQFNIVEVYDRVGGDLLSTYTVEDRKQVAEFDPLAWIDDQLDDEEEEEESPQCPICGTSDDEDVLLLCDGCDAAYHTYCIGMDRVPHGRWFCMECADEGVLNAVGHARSAETQRAERQIRTFNQRTQAQLRRARQRARTDAWQGAWSQISSRVWDALNLDLDYDDDDQSLAAYRQHQTRSDRERREFQQWQQRLNIAGRQGARDIFRQAARPIINARDPAQTTQQSDVEKKAWDVFERARVGEPPAQTRKRKSRSRTQSPRETNEPQSDEPERKLKRPRTRRVVDKTDSPSDGQPESSNRNSSVSSAPRPRLSPAAAPSFLSSLLREVEMSSKGDDESVHALNDTSATSPSAGHSSPVMSPVTSNYSTPRAMSLTPPPHGAKRPGSPLPLTSHLDSIFSPTEFSPNRSPDSNYKSTGVDRQTSLSPPAPELRQPRPRRPPPPHASRSSESSPTRVNISMEAKEGINKIVRSALAPYYHKPSGITKEQYADINRLVSRMLYERIPERDALDEKAKPAWEQIATAEVDKAVERLTA